MKEIKEYLKIISPQSLLWLRGVVSLDGKGSDLGKLIESIKQAQKDSWNEAVKECAEDAETCEEEADCSMNCYSNLFQGNLGSKKVDKYETVVDKNSILKLLKE